MAKPKRTSTRLAPAAAVPNPSATIANVHEKNVMAASRIKGPRLAPKRQLKKAQMIQKAKGHFLRSCNKCK